MYGITRTKMRRGAINDMKNEVTYAIEDGKKIMITISKEEIRCKQKPRDSKGRVLKKENARNID